MAGIADFEMFTILLSRPGWLIFGFLKHKPVLKPEHSESQCFKIFVPGHIFPNLYRIPMRISIKLNYRLKRCLLSIRIKVIIKIESTTPARLFIFCTSDDFVVWPPLLQKEGKLLSPKLLRLTAMPPGPLLCLVFHVLIPPALFLIQTNSSPQPPSLKSKRRGCKTLIFISFSPSLRLKRTKR